MVDKKVRERALLEEFWATCSNFPNGLFEDSESPDFLLRVGDKVTGIDLVEYQRGQGGKGGSPHRAGERFRADIMARAQEIFEETNDLPLIVATQWYPSGGDKKRGKIEALAVAIATVVTSYMQIAPNETKKLDNDHLDGTALVEWLDSISICYVPSQLRGSWLALDRALPSGDSGELERVIADKEKLLPRYREKCDVAWLVIIATGESLASSVEFNDLPLLRSAYDRVYFFDKLAHKSTRLNAEA